MNFKGFNYKWTQKPNDSKWERLYNAQRIMNLAEQIKELDRLEPIKDLTEATKYLNKFQLGR